MTNTHTSISTLSIFAYNQISETHDYTHLIIDRKAKTKKDGLPEIWEAIVAQYLDATSHRESTQDILDLQRAILDITITYNNIKTLIFCCNKSFEQYVIDELNSYGYEVKSKKDLKGVERSCKGMLTQKREYDFELAQRLLKQGETTTFEKIMDRICDHKGLRINPRETTVKEWIAIEDNFLDDIKKQRTKARE